MLAPKRIARIIATAVVAGCAAIGGAQAGGNGPLRMPAENWTIPYGAGPRAIPACTDSSVLYKIADRFAETESDYWNSSLKITGFEKIRAVAFRPWGLDYIPRLFCAGEVVTSDGRKRSIEYSVGEDTGFIGASWGVEWCVGGLDRQRAYAPNCRAAGP